MSNASRPSSYCRPGDDDPSLAKINMAVYSHPGEGKTVFWGSGSERVCFMVSDPEGTISARSLGFKPHSVQVTDYEELQEAYEWFAGSAEPKRNGIQWIVWDSLTLFQDRALADDIMVDAVAENPKQDVDVPSRREYFQSMNRIGRYVRQFVDLPYNFGISCHVLMDSAPDGDGTIFMPSVQGKNMASKVSGYMNVVGYLGKAQNAEGKTVQRMQFRKQGRYYAKDRFNCLGGTEGYMDRPTLPKIDTLVEEWRKQMKKKAASAATPNASATQKAK
jgi:hypothetical protein